jgi:hypothetical protein
MNCWAADFREVPLQKRCDFVGAHSNELFADRGLLNRERLFAFAYRRPVTARAQAASDCFPDSPLLVLFSPKKLVAADLDVAFGAAGAGAVHRHFLPIDYH